MNAVETIKYNLDDQAFFGLFHTPEIKARRAERMRQAQRQASQATYGAGYTRGYAIGEAHAKTKARKEYENRERALIKAKDQEAASLAADVAGGLTMAAALVAIAMMV